MSSIFTIYYYLYHFKKLTFNVSAVTAVKNVAEQNTTKGTWTLVRARLVFSPTKLAI
jgi:hypothetical protein